MCDIWKNEITFLKCNVMSVYGSDVTADATTIHSLVEEQKAPAMIDGEEFDRYFG